MVFKINIGTKDGKTWKIESESSALEGKELKQVIKGEEVSPDLAGYEFEITGASDKSGFTSLESVDGFARKRMLLDYGTGMKKRPKHEGKHTRAKNRPKGLRLRKTIRGKVISLEIVQINLKLVKEGSKKLEEIFPDQAPQPAEPEPAPETKESAPEKSFETKEEPKQEEKTSEEKAGELPSEEKEKPVEEKPAEEKKE